MYKFTNGIVVFDEKTRDAYIKAGMVLAEKIAKVLSEGNSSEKPKGLMSEFEVTNENSSNNGTFEEKSRRSNKKFK